MNERIRVALITGAAGAISGETSEALAKTCKTIVGFDLPGIDQSKTKARVEAQGAEYIAVEVNIADEDSVAEAFKVIEKLGRCDILCNIAGIAPTNAPTGFAWPVDEMPLEEFMQVINVNLTGTFLVSRAAVPYMKRNGWGRIINTTSSTARAANALSGVHYPASKAGVGALTRAMAQELAAFGITCNLVSPGLSNTRMSGPYMDGGMIQQTILAMIPQHRLGEPTDMANAYAFLASEESGYITGITLDVNGGSYMAL